MHFWCVVHTFPSLVRSRCDECNCDAMRGSRLMKYVEVELPFWMWITRISKNLMISSESWRDWTDSIHQLSAMLAYLEFVHFLRKCGTSINPIKDIMMMDDGRKQNSLFIAASYCKKNIN